MEYRRMGRTGLKVSEICLGTMTFGHGTDQAEANRIVDLAFDAGVNFFDTADSYRNGQSEILLGQALKGQRRGAVVATKRALPGRTCAPSCQTEARLFQIVELLLGTGGLRLLQRSHLK